ncbi:receptor homology region, transmembrane domain- and RING domain-containing protein 6-like [Salvia hispanica]|uniref:receptor homology region, transmembrane domain- and RING domain-containing protein 6-like n=1 Tax=Salvia hispanica TaxID=49212 RepID=UPI002009C25D|nr:receptor homology region, transmembrane domain- and RING domain-containing protein 6-like [Salvia hispanica]
MDESAAEELEMRMILETIVNDYLATMYRREWLVISEDGDDILSLFETRQYNNTDDVEDGDETDNCCICLERLHRGLVATLHCRHEFHGGCIGRWLRGGRNFCPLCKARAINSSDLIS